MAMLGDKMVIEWVYRVAERVFDRVVVATDDSRIAEAVESFGGCAIMTSPSHRCGTERCAEALAKIGGEWDGVVNIQGDEPFTTEEQLQSIASLLCNPNIDIATLATPIVGDSAKEDICNPNIVKVAISRRSTALYFSRSPIPYHRFGAPTYYRHVGIYGFRHNTLLDVVSLEPSPLELAESLEQLRWLEEGYNIGVGITEDVGIGIDTPEDLVRAEVLLSKYVSHE